MNPRYSFNSISNSQLKRKKLKIFSKRTSNEIPLQRDLNGKLRLTKFLKIT